MPALEQGFQPGRNSFTVSTIVSLKSFILEASMCIEEIESTLRSHDSIRSVSTVVRDSKVTCYVSLDIERLKENYESKQFEDDMVNEWGRVYETVYSIDVIEPNFVSWNSVYTGQPIPINQMQDWIRSTVGRIHALKPRRVLDIGCGTGLVLQHIAPTCDAYLATDVSGEVISRLNSWLKLQPQLSHVETRQCSAFSAATLVHQSYDTVIINSVIQLFPDIRYLRRLIDSVIESMPLGGNIFIGDVRNFKLLRLLHGSVQFQRADGRLLAMELRKNVRDSLVRDQERELSIDPIFFTLLSSEVTGISDARIMLKESDDDNELTKYRYDVVLRVSAAEPERKPIEQVEWGDVASEQSFGDLCRRRSEPLRVMHIPNARLARDIAIGRLIDSAEELCTVEELRSLLGNQLPESAHPESCRKLANSYEREMLASWSLDRDNGEFDVSIGPGGAERGSGVSPTNVRLPKASGAQVDRTYASDPLGSRLSRRVIGAMSRELKKWVPSVYESIQIVLMEDAESR